MERRSHRRTYKGATVTAPDFLDKARQLLEAYKSLSDKETDDLITAAGIAGIVLLMLGYIAMSYLSGTKPETYILLTGIGGILGCNGVNFATVINTLFKR
jgi:hypothetical protein